MGIIIIEDNLVFRDYVCDMLENEGYTTRTAYDCVSAHKLLATLEEEDIVLSDLRLPDGECTVLLEYMRASGMMNPFIVMTDYAQVASAVCSMRLGAEDYIPKKLLQEKLLLRIRELVDKAEAKHKIFIFERKGTAFQEINHRISLVAPTDIGVLILGENGTGKEHVAEKIHTQSTRQKGPFVAIDCGMLTRELAASELFGYEKGAFTGAITGKKGCMAEADGGTLFLDEVGNLPAEVQQKLLRALQTKCYRPTGCTRERKVDVRIVAATNENLEKAVEEGRFRRDLYHRLKEFVIKIPPLRECREDILPLAEFFRELANKELGRHTEGFDKEAEKELMRRMWAGNVRELKQTVRSAVLLTEGRLIGADRLEAESTAQASSSLLLKDGNEERERIVRALAQADGNREMTAGLLGISRTTLYNKMKEYGIMQKKSEKRGNLD